jgi:hypothetical protein
VLEGAVGQEARCRVRFGGRVSEGRALLETSELLFRGEFRLKIPFGEMQSVEARDGDLAVAFAGGLAAFELGRQAERWAEKIRNPRGLLDKLGVKAESRVAVLGITDDGFLGQLRERVGPLPPGELEAGLDLIFLGAEAPAELEQLGPLQAHLKRNGAIWVVSPKGRPEIKDTVVMAAAKAAGLVDVKVAGFSATHTALKLVIPLARR